MKPTGIFFLQGHMSEKIGNQPHRHVWQTREIHAKWWYSFNISISTVNQNILGYDSMASHVVLCTSKLARKFKDKLYLDSHGTNQFSYEHVNFSGTQLPQDRVIKGSLWNAPLEHNLPFRPNASASKLLFLHDGSSLASKWSTNTFHEQWVFRLSLCSLCAMNNDILHWLLLRANRTFKNGRNLYF